VQAAAAAESAWHDLGARNVAVLYAAGHSYTRLLQDYFRTRFTALGGKVVSVRDYSDDALDNIAVGVEDVDLVFLATASADETLTIIQRLRAAGVTAPVLGGDSYDSEALWQRNLSIRDVYFTTHAYLGEHNPNPRVRAFRKAYIEAYDDSHPNAFAALGYDTVRLLMAAISAAGSREPAAVRRALAGIREFTGVTGALHYPDGSRVPLKSVSVLRIDAGSVSLFREFTPAQVPPP
jgi:branched-chain amino acid transport system substrate-binding protein